MSSFFIALFANNMTVYCQDALLCLFLAQALVVTTHGFSKISVTMRNAMMPVSLEQLDLLTREELIALLKALLPEFELLRQRVANLEAENESLKQQLTGSTNSRNSSQPPSRDQKPNLPPGKTKKNTGRLSVIRSFRARWWTIRIA